MVSRDMSLHRSCPRFLATTLGLGLMATPALASPQRGDKKNEVQAPLPDDLRLPKAAVLSPAEALAAFQVIDGYRIEVVAHEPLVEDPVQVAFDARGRLFVVEMRGYMPDPDATGELEPTGKIAILTDRDGDGRFDSRLDFASGLVLPRGVLPYRDGALLILPPRLVFARDTNDDGVADVQETVLETGFEAGLDNPEHAGNQPTLGHDGWISFANFGLRLRQGRDGKWEQQRTHKSGQWGLSQDDWGLHAYNYNSSWVHGDRYPAYYAVRNPRLGVALGVGERWTGDQSLHPIRKNPGINRGYQKGMLKDGKLAVTTAVCGPGFYRGGLLPDAWIGDVFVPEPAANLVRHMQIKTEPDGSRQATNRWPGREFLASTDERFRPVQCVTGPDGALYVVDFYRGILQHKNFLTTFLRQQIEERGLAVPVGLGRIYRVVPDGAAKVAALPKLAERSCLEQVALLAERNGVVRELAQASIVEQYPTLAEADAAACVGALQALLGHEAPHARYHAARTLALIAVPLEGVLSILAKDGEPRLRALALQLGEAVAGFDAARFVHDKDPLVRTQVALSCAGDEGRWPLLADFLEAHGDDRLLREAAISGLAGRELAFAAFLGARGAWTAEAPDGAIAFFRRLAQCVAADRRSKNIAALLGAAADRPAKWQRVALVEGCVAALPKGEARKGALRFDDKPAVLAALRVDLPARVHEALDEAVTWPGKAGAVADAAPLTADQEKLFRLGNHSSTAPCVQCHQADGQGQAGLAPTLHDSQVVLGPAARQIRVVLHGLTGPVTIAGKTQDLTMEPLGAKLDDRQLAAILTFTRRSWGHRATAVDPQEVAKVRRQTEDRKLPWTREELSKIE